MLMILCIAHWLSRSFCKQISCYLSILTDYAVGEIGYDKGHDSDPHAWSDSGELLCSSEVRKAWMASNGSLVLTTTLALAFLLERLWSLSVR